MMNNRYFQLAFLMIMATGIFTSCKKHSITADDTSITATGTSTVSGTRDELSKDSIFLYSKELYYWYSSLPTYETFKPRSFSSNETELYALTQYSTNPSTGYPYEYVSGETYPKYSFLDYVSTTGTTSALKADINTENDYGFSVFYNYNDLSDLRVKYVYSNSPAAKQGLTRGCKITSVNGQTNLSYSTSINTFLINAIFGTNASVSLSFTDLSGISKTVVVTSAAYTISPILYTNVYTEGTKKVGYIVFNSFTNNATTALNTAFADFASQGVTELVVDLRYNGGGYVSTATQIVNLAAPASQNGNTMFTYYYNTYLQNLTTAQRKASVMVHQPLLDDSDALQYSANAVNGKYYTYADLDYTSTSSDNIEKFTKSGSLALSRIYFIVTGSTASASELTINSLKPVMDVKLIGSTTYGKPVGFFPIRINDFDMYIPEFETKNQSGTGGYYSGMTVDKSANDDVTKAWGDESEGLLKYALQYAKTGSFVTSTTEISAVKTGTNAITSKLSSAEIITLTNSLDQHSFRGMIKTPHKKM